MEVPRMRIGLLALLANLALWAAPPALSARIAHTHRVETPDGMTKTTTFEERFYRTADRVWLERVLPPSPAKGPSATEAPHLHPGDLGIAARYLIRKPTGELDLTFVHPARVKVHAESRDYPEVGFDGSWANAFHLLDPEHLKVLKPLPREAPKGARWYGTEDATKFLRVLWSTDWELPLRMEAGSPDGRRLNITEFQPGPLPATLPWDQLAGMGEKDYTDLLD